MGAYSTHFWGIDLTSKYDVVEEAMPSIDPETELFGPDVIASLGDYIEHHKLGRSMYDGGGYGQITYIGSGIGNGPRGITVTDEHIEKVAAIIAIIPDELKAALIEVYGRIPEPKFHIAEGWG